jgi:hypothetical protein
MSSCFTASFPDFDAPDTVFNDSDGDGFRADPISLEENGLGALRTGDYELLQYRHMPIWNCRARMGLLFPHTRAWNHGCDDPVAHRVRI